MSVPRSLTLEEAFGELMRLRRIARLAYAWAKSEHATRADLHAVERELRDEAIAWGEGR